MAKKGKLTTPEWILEGYDSKEEYEKAKGLSGKNRKDVKTFKIRECPKCGSDNVGLVLTGEEGEEGGGKEWECRKCKWVGENIKEKDLTEEELMEYLDKKGEEVA